MTPEDIDSGSFTFPSTEKLKYRKSIQILFDQGRHISIAPIRVIYLLTADDALPACKGSRSANHRLRACWSDGVWIEFESNQGTLAW